MWVALPELVKLAPAVGLPRDKKRLTARLLAGGGVSRRGAPRRGGRPVEWRTDSLPKPLQAIVEPEAPAEAEPVPFDRYLEATATMKARADRRLAIMDEFASLTRTLSVSKAAATLAKRPGYPSASTIEGYWRLVRNLPWSEWRAALLSDHKGRAPTVIPEPAWLFYKGFYGREEKPTATHSYEETVRAGHLQGWGDLPSLKTFERRWNKIDVATRVRWREGAKGAERLIPTGELDRSGTAALDSFAVDGRLFDLNVWSADGGMHRRWVVAAVDEATSYCLGYAIAEEGESESGNLYRRLLITVFDRHGLPRVCTRFDNTMAAGSKKITGGMDTRFRFSRKDDELDGILKRVGVPAKFTLPGQPQGKVVERFWADVKTRTEKDIRCAGAYTGRSPDNKPSNYGEDAVSIETFSAVLAEGIAEYNSRSKRRSKVAAGISYAQAFEAKLKGVIPRKLTTEQRRWFTADAHAVVPSADGKVRIGRAPFHNTYRHDDLRAFGVAREKVVILVDPDDFTAPVMAMRADDGSVIARAVPLVEKYGADNAADAAALARAKNAVRKADRESRQAERRYEAAELAVLRAPAASDAQGPTAPVYQMVPGTFPNAVAKGKRTARVPADRAPTPYDADKVAHADRLRGFEPEPEYGGFDPAKVAEAERLLALVRVVA